MTDQPSQPARFVDPAVAAPATPAQPATTPPAGTDLLSALARGFRAQAKTLEVEVADADHNAWIVRLDATIPWEEYQAWVMQAQDATSPMGLNQLTLAVTAIGYKTKSILLAGEELTGSDGTPLTFDSTQLQQLLGAIDTSDCLRKFFRSDGAVIAASGALMAEAGYTLAGPPRR